MTHKPIKITIEKIPIRKRPGNSSSGTTSYPTASETPPTSTSYVLQKYTSVDETHIRLLADSISGHTLPSSDLNTYTFSIDNSGYKYIVPGELYVVDGASFTKHTFSDRYYLGGNSGRATLGVLSTFEFYVQPARIDPTYRKLFSEIRTRGGWEVQHWDNALTEIRVQGVTGNLLKVKRDNSIPETYSALNEREDITNSYAWKKLEELKKLYDEDHASKNLPQEYELRLTYIGRSYVGYFTDFTGPSASEDKPYLITYAFSFKALREELVPAATTSAVVTQP